MLRVYTSDLHIHTCLSPCGALEMAPVDIVRKAQAAGVDLISITDHNSAKNVRAVREAAHETGLSVVPGMEVQTLEEVHVLTLFGSLDTLEEWDRIVYERLPDIANNPEYFGDQAIVTAQGEITAFEPKLLLNSIEMTLDEVCRTVMAMGGLCIPAHADKNAFGIIGQLGFIPGDLDIVAVEVFDLARLEELPELQKTRIISSSDAHFLVDIGSKRTRFRMADTSFGELALALRGRDGRDILPIQS
jgi:hypothetical protein